MFLSVERAGEVACAIAPESSVRKFAVERTADSSRSAVWRPPNRSANLAPRAGPPCQRESHQHQGGHRHQQEWSQPWNRSRLLRGSLLLRPIVLVVVVGDGGPRAGQINLLATRCERREHRVVAEHVNATRIAVAMSDQMPKRTLGAKSLATRPPLACTWHSTYPYASLVCIGFRVARAPMRWLRACKSGRVSRSSNSG